MTAGATMSEADDASATMSEADDAGEPKTEFEEQIKEDSVWYKRHTQVCVNPDGKSCARKGRTRYLPQNLLFDIFLRLPAKVLSDVMRHVCKEWDLVIRNPNFIRQHLRNSTSIIIIEKLFWDNSEVCLEMQGGCLKISKFDWGFRGRVWTSCNGLVLAPPPDLRDLHILSVINPLTKQRVLLPPYFDAIRNHAYFRLAFVEASMEYKVVCAIDNGPLSVITHIAVLTVGVDKVWRQIDVSHLSLPIRRAFRSSSVVTGAYIHWTESTFVLTFNVDTETICQFPVTRRNERSKTFLPMGSNLSLVSGESSREVWEMDPTTGEWINLLTFDLGPLSHIFPHSVCSIVPFGWLEVREVLLLSTQGFKKCFVAYNIKTKEVHPYELDHKGPLRVQYHLVESHVNSLVRLEG